MLNGWMNECASEIRVFLMNFQTEIEILAAWYSCISMYICIYLSMYIYDKYIETYLYNKTDDCRYITYRYISVYV